MFLYQVINAEDKCCQIELNFLSARIFVEHYFILNWLKELCNKKIEQSENFIKILTIGS